MRIGLVFRSLFQSLDRKNLGLSQRTLQRILDCQTENAVDYLVTYPQTPSLFGLGDAGLIRYKLEPPGIEDFCAIDEIIANKGGDCDDIAPWRAAELRVRHGIRARCIFQWKLEPVNGQLYHIQVEYPDGRIEDPCKRLGM